MGRGGEAERTVTGRPGQRRPPHAHGGGEAGIAQASLAFAEGFGLKFAVRPSWAAKGGTPAPQTPSGQVFAIPFSLGCPDGSQHPLPNLHSSSGTGGLPPSTPRPHEEEKGRQQPSRSGSEVSMGLALVLNIQCLEISWVYF